MMQNDPDNGPNNRQNFPTLSTVSATVNTATILGTLNSTPNETFRVELFTNDSCDPSGYGEGQYFLTAFDNIATDSGGDATLDFDVFGDFVAGTFLTATATDSGNNTSEFSACLEITSIDETLLVVNNTSDANDGVCDTNCSLRDALAEAGSLSGIQTIAFDIPGSAPFMIYSASQISVDDVIIDGTTQPGYSGSPIIVLNGSNYTYSLGNGLDVDSDTTIRGLVIQDFNENGIYMSGANNVIQGNYIGTNVAGTSAVPNGNHGIRLGGTNNLVGGTTTADRNIISGNEGNGIRLVGDLTMTTTDIVVQGNFIGTDVTGTNAIPNAENGIYVSHNEAIIGGSNVSGTCSGACNLISGNTQSGILLIDAFANAGVDARDNIIQGNFIGTNVNGTAALPNQLSGIWLDDGARNNTIGGTGAGEGNLISGNNDYGVRSDGDNLTRSHTIQGNLIGTTPTGMTALGNEMDGIYVGQNSDLNNILDNLISGNGGNGLTLYRSDDNTIQGNLIGTNATGDTAIANVDAGIVLTEAHNNQIGGPNAGEENLISGNGDTGISLFNSDDNVLQRNLVGTNGSGSAALGNASAGIHVENATIATLSNNIVSGNSTAGVHILNSTDVSITSGSVGAASSGTAALPNQIGIHVEGSQNTAISNVHIAGNTDSGLVIDNSDDTTVSGSVIGAAGDTINPLPNGGSGIEIINNSQDTSISDNDTQGGLVYNIIAFNGIDGITIASGQRNLIGLNQINDNGALGIDLGADGVTANDVGDGDTGANGLLNAPELTSVNLQNGTLVISGAYNSVPSTTYTMALYRSTACDPSGYGEGQLLSSDLVDVVTDATGNATISVELSWTILDTFITARISDPVGNSSEFSNCMPITRVMPVPSNFQVNVLSEIDIQADWQDASTEETHFLLERSISGEDDWTEIVSVLTNDGPGTGDNYTHHDTDFLCSEAYDYRLRAYDESSEFYSAYTSVLTASPTCPPLNAPGSFTATVVDYSQIDLSWTDENTTETEIVIEHSINNGASWHTLFVLDADTTNTQHTGLQCLSLHSYRARAVRDHDSAVSPNTPVETATTDGCPTAEPPMNISATPQSGNSMAVSWQVSIPGLVTTFHLERSLDSSNWSEIFVLPQHVTNITDANLLCNTQYHYRVRSYRQVDASYSAYSTVANATTLACPTPVTRTVGLNQNGRWHFWETNAPNSPLVSFDFGPQQAGWQPITGDWDGDGTDGIGLYKDGVWLLRDVSEGGPIEQVIHFGPAEAGWQAIAGDWNGDGMDGIGLYKNGRFILRQTASAGSPDMSFAFGPAEAGWIPVAGDWNNSGNDSVGLFKVGLWLLSNQLPAIADIAPISFGQAGWNPVVGDWNEDGVTSIGIYANGQWYLRNTNTSGLPDLTFGINSAPNNWRPIANYRGGVGGLMILSQSVAAPTPTLTATPAPTQMATAEVPTEITPENEPSATPDVETTVEVVPSTPTDLPSATPTETTTPSPMLTETTLPSATPTMTSTLVPPTATPEPSPTNPPAPESTAETTPGE